MRRIKVGIIDSGINPDAAGSHPFSAMTFCEETHPDGDFIDHIGHGSEVIKIISGTDVGLELYIAKVFNNRLVCSTEQVASALEWLVDHGVSIINMSFGMRTDRNSMRLSCEKAVQNGCILVASSPAQGPSTYPALYPSVVRATGDARCKLGEISWLGSEQADFGAYVGNPQGAVAGSSIGCAGVTAAIIRLLAENGNADYGLVMRLLPERAQYKGREYLSTPYPGGAD